MIQCQHVSSENERKSNSITFIGHKSPRQSLILKFKFPVKMKLSVTREVGLIYQIYSDLKDELSLHLKCVCNYYSYLEWPWFESILDKTSYIQMLKQQWITTKDKSHFKVVGGGITKHVSNSICQWNITFFFYYMYRVIQALHEPSDPCSRWCSWLFSSFFCLDIIIMSTISDYTFLAC